MIKENNHFKINRCQTDVFNFISNDNNLSQWVNGIVAIRPIGQHKNDVGDAIMIDVNVPKEATIKSTLTQWQPPHSFSTAYSTKGMTGTMSFKLEVIDENNTLVRFSASHQPKGAIMKICSPLIAWVIKKERKEEHRRLTQAIED